MNIRAIAFDIDGTMYNNMDMYLRSLPFALKNFTLLRAFQRARNDMRAQGLAGDFYGNQARKTAGYLRMDVDRCRRLIDERVYQEWELSLKGIPLAPGFFACIEALHAQGIPLGVLSDFPVGRKLSLLGLPSVWTAVMSTETVGHLKPDHRGFEALARAMEIPPGEILYVGNSYTFDVMGARSVGMKTAHFSKKKVKQSLADFTFNHYADLLTWITTQRS